MKPPKMTTMPTSRVTAKAVMAPNTELSVPLAPRTRVPRAMSPLDHTSRVPAGDRRSRHALHAAPAKMTTAPPADPTPASTRGRAAKTREPWTSWSGGRGWVNGAVTTTPAANAVKQGDHDGGPVTGAASGQQVHRAQGQDRDVDDGAEEVEDPEHRTRPPGLGAGGQRPGCQGEHGQGGAPRQLVPFARGQPPLEGRQREGHGDERGGHGNSGLDRMTHVAAQATPSPAVRSPAPCHGAGPGLASRRRRYPPLPCRPEDLTTPPAGRTAAAARAGACPVGSATRRGRIRPTRRAAARFGAVLGCWGTIPFPVVAWPAPERPVAVTLEREIERSGPAGSGQGGAGTVAHSWAGCM